LHGNWNSANQFKTKENGFQDSSQAFKTASIKCFTVGVQEQEQRVLFHGTKLRLLIRVHMDGDEVK
jgi:hypothetical protein